MRLILDNQFKIIFDEPIEITEDNVGDLAFLINSLEVSLGDSDITFGPRKPNIKDVHHIAENERFAGLLFTFERGLAKTGQIGISSESIKEIVSTEMEIQGFDISEEDMSIERVNIFEEYSR